MKLFFFSWSSFAFFLNTPNCSSFSSHFLLSASISMTIILHLSSFDDEDAADRSFSKMSESKVEIVFSILEHSALMVCNSFSTWISLDAFSLPLDSFFWSSRWTCSGHFYWPQQLFIYLDFWRLNLIHFQFFIFFRQLVCAWKGCPGHDVKRSILI